MRLSANQWQLLVPCIASDALQSQLYIPYHVMFSLLLGIKINKYASGIRNLDSQYLSKLHLGNLKAAGRFTTFLEPDLMTGGTHQNMKQNGTIFLELSVSFWDNTWKLHSSIRDNNPFKWFSKQ